MQAAIRLAELNLARDMASIKMVFGANLRRLMRDRDMQAKELARILGVSASIVTHWRNCEKLPTAENIEGIAMALKVPYTELFREGVDPNPGGLPEAEDAMKALAKAFGMELTPAKKRRTPRDD